MRTFKRTCAKCGEETDCSKFSVDITCDGCGKDIKDIAGSDQTLSLIASSTVAHEFCNTKCLKKWLMKNVK